MVAPLPPISGGGAPGPTASGSRRGYPGLAPRPSPGAPGLAAPAPVDDLAPRYPNWLYTSVTQTDPLTGEERRIRTLSPPKEPDKAQFDAWITADTTLYGDLLSRLDDDILAYRGLGWGRGAQFDPDRDTPFIDSEVTLQINKIAAMVAGTPFTINYPSKTDKERKDAQAMESFALWAVAEWAYRHRLNGNSDLLHEIAWYLLVLGRAVTESRCDLDDADFPWFVWLHDPATCYPIFGDDKYGLRRMTRQYTTTLGEILDVYDPSGSKGLLATLSRERGKRRRAQQQADLLEEKTVSECHTRWHRYVAVEGQQIELVAHEYGEVPFCVEFAPGEPGAMGTPRLPAGRRRGRTAREVKLGYADGGGRGRQRDLVEKGQSFLYPVRYALWQRERVLGEHMTAIALGNNPPTITENPYPEPPEPLDMGPGGSNERKQGQRTTPVIPSPRPLDSGPVLTQLTAEIAKGMLPDVVFGQTDGANNISGFASDSLMAAAKDRIQPYLSGTEHLIADTLALMTRQFYNHGHLAEGLVDGQLIIPAANRAAGFAQGSKVARPPQWALPIIQRMFQTALGPGGVLGPPPLPGPANAVPGGGGMEAAQPPMAVPGMGGIGTMGGGGLGQPGYVAPEWTMGALPEEDAPVVAISRQIIDRVSARPAVKLNNLGLSNKTVLSNYLGMLVRDKIMPRVIAMQQVPEIQDVVEAWTQIIAEDAQTNPQMLQMIYHPRALWEQGDLDGFFTYWATILLPAMAGPLMGLAGGGGPPTAAAPPGPGAAPPPGPEAAGVQGGSAAELGQGPGAEGAPVGRPT